MTADFAQVVAQTTFEGRALAESRMLTTVAIQYETGVTPDPVTDADVPTYTTAFSTKSRIKSPGLVMGLAEAGGRTAAESKRELDIPATSADPWADVRSAHGVTALVTAVDPTDDPTLLGVRLVLSGPAPGSQTTARRLQVTEVVT